MRGRAHAPPRARLRDQHERRYGIPAAVFHAELFIGNAFGDLRVLQRLYLFEPCGEIFPALAHLRLRGCGEHDIAFARSEEARNERGHGVFDDAALRGDLHTVLRKDGGVFVGGEGAAVFRADKQFAGAAFCVFVSYGKFIADVFEDPGGKVFRRAPRGDVGERVHDIVKPGGRTAKRHAVYGIIARRGNVRAVFERNAEEIRGERTDGIVVAAGIRLDIHVVAEHPDIPAALFRHARGVVAVFPALHRADEDLFFCCGRGIRTDGELCAERLFYGGGDGARRTRSAHIARSVYDHIVFPYLPLRLFAAAGGNAEQQRKRRQRRNERGNDLLHFLPCTPFLFIRRRSVRRSG